MTRFGFVDRKQMSPQYAQLVERVKSADGSVNFFEHDGSPPGGR